MFWICRTYTRISIKAYQKFEDNERFENKDESYIIWFDATKIRLLKIPCF